MILDCDSNQIDGKIIEASINGICVLSFAPRLELPTLRQYGNDEKAVPK
jgi:hypothetical protein